MGGCWSYQRPDILNLIVENSALEFRTAEPVDIGFKKRTEAKAMAKGRSTTAQQRANQQRIEAGYNVVTSSSVIDQPSKAELRASIPAYDPSMIKKIPEKVKKKPKK